LQEVLRPMIKVCGVARPEDVEWLDGMVDYIGVIVGSKVSPRVVDENTARSIIARVSASKPVLVTVGVSIGRAAELAAKLGASVLQYHNPLECSTLELLAAAAREQGVRIAPVILYDGRGWTPDPKPLRNCLSSPGAADAVEYVLLDAVKGVPMPRPRIPPGEVRRTIEALQGLRVGVAGGLDPDNVCAMVRVGVDLVDVSSGVELQPGVKDRGLVKLFVREVERCGRSI